MTDITREQEEREWDRAFARVIDTEWLGRADERESAREREDRLAEEWRQFDESMRRDDDWLDDEKEIA